jgi:hypothetical protein
MYESLKKHCPNFHLYVFAFDDLSLSVLKYMALEKTTIIALKEFECSKLLEVKPTRTKAEYCWTCTAFTILHCLKKYNLDHCTYVDADLCFYSDPSVLINEMQNESVLITPHNYSQEYERNAATHGKYCVQFVTFKNDFAGLHVLNWWANACLDWCYARFENKKFGDQKYLDDWPECFSNVHVLQNFGGGIAPWNATRYTLGKNYFVRDICNNTQQKLCFYHFHDIKFDEQGKINKDYLLAYKIHWRYVAFIYLPYLLHFVFVNIKLRNRNKAIKFLNKRNVFKMLAKLLLNKRKMENMEKLS